MNPYSPLNDVQNSYDYSSLISHNHNDMQQIARETLIRLYCQPWHDGSGRTGSHINTIISVLSSNGILNYDILNRLEDNAKKYRDEENGKFNANYVSNAALVIQKLAECGLLGTVLHNVLKYDLDNVAYIIENLGDDHLLATILSNQYNLDNVACLIENLEKFNIRGTLPNLLQPLQYEQYISIIQPQSIVEDMRTHFLSYYERFQHNYQRLYEQPFYQDLVSNQGNGFVRQLYAPGTQHTVQGLLCEKYQQHPLISQLSNIRPFPLWEQPVYQALQQNSTIKDLFFVHNEQLSQLFSSISTMYSLLIPNNQNIVQIIGDLNTLCYDTLQLLLEIKLFLDILSKSPFFNGSQSNVQTYQPYEAYSSYQSLTVEQRASQQLTLALGLAQKACNALIQYIYDKFCSTLPCEIINKNRVDCMNHFLGALQEAGVVGANPTMANIMNTYAHSGFISVAEALFQSEILSCDDFKKVIFHHESAAGIVKSFYEICDSLSKMRFINSVYLELFKSQMSAGEEQQEFLKAALEIFEESCCLNYEVTQKLIELAPYKTEAGYSVAVCVIDFAVNRLCTYGLLQEPESATKNILALCKYYNIFIKLTSFDISNQKITSLLQHNQALFDQCINLIDQMQRVSTSDIVQYIDQYIAVESEKIDESELSESSSVQQYDFA